jgi:hypothetical protein
MIFDIIQTILLVFVILFQAVLIAKFNVIMKVLHIIAKLQDFTNLFDESGEQST